MKKILFISSRNPYSGRYSGDVIRSLRIINLLKKKFKLDIIYLKKSNEPNFNLKNTLAFNQPNLFLKILFCLKSIFKLEPIQFGLFFSKDMSTYLKNNSYNYDYLFFYHIRTSQYLPHNFNGKTFLEMGDLYSENYYQTFKNLNFLNPLKYIYFFESWLMKNYEKKVFSTFDRVTLFSKREIEKVKKTIKVKVYQVEECIEKINNKFLFSKNNSRILFVGNLDYLPNYLACKEFINKILPDLKIAIPLIKFCIIGNISPFKRFILGRNSNVEIIGPKKNLSKYIKTSICGLANLKIATGIQVKVLTYMSHGLPVICTKKVAENFKEKVLIFNSKSDLINKITLLKENKKQSLKFSKKSLLYSKRFILKKIINKYVSLLNF